LATVPQTPDRPSSADQELVEAWQLLMGLILDQRWRWPEVSGELGISQAGLRALLAIDPDDPRPMRDLARAMNCDASYVTAMIDDLEQAGYAERRPATEDRRVKIVALTDAGSAALRTAQDGLLAPPPQLSRLTRSQQRSLARLLRQALNDGSWTEGGARRPRRPSPSGRRHRP
jgi:DNA-binding MarR family transcriptional regulator